VEVKSKASGEVLSVHVETGDRVEQGQLLAEVDPRDVQNALDQAVADLESAEVQASTTEANRSRMEALRRTSAVTQQEYESAVQAAASAHAAVVRARTNLQLARERRSDVIIRAPIAGTILADNLEPGQIISSATGNVSGGTVLFTMADLSEMQVRTLVDETDIGQIQPGQSAQLTVEAYPERTFRAEVYKIEPQAVVEQNVTTFPVLVRLSNPEDLLKPGMNAEVAVEIATRRDVVVVPNGAVVTPRDASSAAAALGLDAGILAAGRESADGVAGAGQSGAPTEPALVFVQRPEGVEARRVVLGVSDWENTEVVEGLEAGERVIEVSGAQLQQAQQQEQDRFRERRGGGMLGGGGGGGGG
jgi:HlyD family secretion protein